MKDYKELLGKIGKDKLLLMAAAGIVLIVCSVPAEKKENTAGNIADIGGRKEQHIFVCGKFRNTSGGYYRGN